MYCKKCGQQLREGAAFCGNCGAPIRTQNQKTAADGGRSVGTSMNPAAPKAVETKRNEKKNGGKKIFAILLLCLLLVLAGGAGGWFFMYKLNEEKLEAAVIKEESEEETKKIDEEDKKEKDQETEEKEDGEVWQEAAVDEMLDKEDTEPIYHEAEENGIHTYELIVDDVTWTEAYYVCLARGGHLVRINSEEEYQAILQQIEEEEKGNIKFWLGGARSAEDVYEYRWIYEDGAYGSEILNEDEPFVAYWLDGEPSFYDESISQDEMYMNMFYVSKEGRWVWNDVPDDLIAAAEFYSGTVGYICEYED